jgi:carbamoylphosphate synthase large subunit
MKGRVYEMGKYLIKVESMDHDEVLNSEYVEGIECDGFVVLAHKGDGCQVAIHQVNVDIISDMIAGSRKVMAASVLAKGKREAADMLRKDEMGDLLGKLLGRD